MSTCISSHGEYSDHVFPSDPTAERFVCTRCFVFDENAAMEALDRAEAKLAASEAIAEAAREFVAADRAYDEAYQCRDLDNVGRLYDVRWAAYDALTAAVDAERATGGES